MGKKLAAASPNAKATTCATYPGGFQILRDPAHDLDAIQLIAVYGAGQAQDRPAARTVDHQYRCAIRAAIEGLSAGPEQPVR